ncbi:MAG: hypothetical protein P0S94_04650, partial [Simkaniaceae bacterium]|nr:hypothetical protein [Simkaniaceae bacterium]
LLLPMLMIAKWESMRKKSNLSEEALLIRNKLLSMRDPLRNHCKPLIQAWHLCMIELNHADITAEIKLSIVSQIVSGPMQDLVKSLYYLLSIISGSPGLLPNHLGENPVETLKKLCEMTLKSDPYLDLSGVENLSEKFRATFAQMRVPAGWKVYERVLITLDDQNVQKEFNRFFISVLEGRHPEERYRTEVEINSHLHHIEKNAPDVLTKWRNGGEQERVMTDDSGSKPFSFTDFLLEKSGDNHWHKDGVDQLPHLTSYLKTGKIDTNSSFFEKVCIELCQDSQITVDKIQAVISSFGQPDLEFANDLAGLTIQFQTKIKAGQVVTIVDTDDWEDLLLCGTEVSESCQRIDGNVINKCLLAYIMDGKNRMIAIKGPRGKLISRAMLRLLWDDTENKPILYLDRIYGVKSSIFLEREIKAYAKKRAVALGCRLSTSYLYNARPALVKSLGSCVPFEYFDSGGGVIENGITEFTVSYVESD